MLDSLGACHILFDRVCDYIFNQAYSLNFIRLSYGNIGAEPDPLALAPLLP